MTEPLYLPKNTKTFVWLGVITNKPKNHRTPVIDVITNNGINIGGNIIKLSGENNIIRAKNKCKNPLFFRYNSF